MTFYTPRYPGDTDAEMRDFYAEARKWRNGCPVCGHRGASHGRWVFAHMRHATARCGKTISARGLKAHQFRCSACAAVTS